MSEHGGDIYRNKIAKDYSVNISPYGTPPQVRAALTKSLLDASVYPDAKYECLRASIGEQEHCDFEYIICGNGASELIYAVARAVAKEMYDSHELIKASILVPCFSEYEKAARAAGIDCIDKIILSEKEDFIPKEEDIDKLLTNSKLIIIGNPNNPTGRVLPKEWLLHLVREAENQKAYIMLDESFLPLTSLEDFYRDVCSKYLIRVKSFTKSMAIPGIRIGYAICNDKELVKRIKEQLPEWNVSVPAMYAGEAATYSKKWLNEQLNDESNGLTIIREILKNELTNLGIKVYPSDTNFILLKSNIELYEKLLEKGILIRKCDNFDGLSPDYYRIAVKSNRENKLLITEIKEVLSDKKEKTRLNFIKPICVKPSEIEKTSFNILTNELYERGIILEKDTAPIIKRCIHTTADFEYVNTLHFSEDAVNRVKQLIREGAHIVTDTNMALTGINKVELAKYNGEAHCFMADPDIAKEAKECGTTRASMSMKHATNLGKKIIFVVGNAPTALITLCEMFDSKTFIPDFVIGVPVGFVNVEQAKEMIISRHIPHIVNRGRKGGSNVAAAIVNALLYDMREEDNA